MNFEMIAEELANLQHKYGAKNPVEKISDERAIIDHHDLVKKAPFLSVSEREVVRYCQTSGSTGEPKYIAYTKNDVDNAVKAQVRAYIFGGVNKFDRSLSVTAYGPWPSGLICQAAGEIIGLTIPAEAKLGIDWQLKAIQRFRPNYMTCIPSFLHSLERGCKERKIQPHNLGLNLIFVVGECLSASDRKHFENEFQVNIRSMYASTEFGVVASECPAGQLHVWADLFDVEIINPQTLEKCEPDEVGELVITALKKEAMPLVRYNTHDLTAIESKPCPCQSPLPVISAIQGRSDDMIVLSGGNIFPVHFEKAVSRVKELSSLFEVQVRKFSGLDQISISAETKKLQSVEIKQDLEKILLETLMEVDPIFPMLIKEWKTLAVPQIEILDPGTLPLGSGKKKKFFDLR